MELTSITSIACIVPTHDKEIAYTSSSFIPPHIQYTQQGDDYQISAKDENETLTWNINHVRTPGTIPEQEQLVNYALNGFDVASLSISVCNGPTQDMYQARKQNLDAIFQILESKLGSKPDIQIEFAYVCLHDQGCYDLRKELDRSNESMIERGLEGIMKPAKLKEIWSDALRGTAWPSILTIKLIDPAKDTVGRLSLVDLLHPRFSSLLNSGKDKCYHSFQKLVNTITAVTTPGYNGKLSTNNCFLIHELEKYITGRNKLIVFGFMNDKMVTEIHWRETKSLLYLMQALKDMPVRMVPNPSAKEVIDNKHLKQSTTTMTKQNKSLKSNMEHLQRINKTLQSTLQEKERELQLFNQVEKQQMDYAQHTIEQYNSDYANIANQLENATRKLKEKNEEISSLSSGIVDLSQQLQDIKKEEQGKRDELVDALEHLLKKNEHTTRQNSELKKENRQLQREFDTVDSDNQYLKVQIQKKRRECFESNTLYDEEKRNCEKLEQKLRTEINARKLLEDKLENMKGTENVSSAELESIKEDLEQKMLEKYELKKKKIQEKAQAKISSFEPILMEKEDKINELLAKIRQLENNTDSEDQD
ncbi:hypothetical protein BDF21DRAFT_491172 [Thamnidium elegans]|nr:hypothetical protein BDF21DRAFT_491172 [Thamnidium elegans]